MVFNSKTNRVSLEPGDTIKCRDAKDAAQLGDILCERHINWEFLYEKNKQKGIWIVILADEEERDEI